MRKIVFLLFFLALIKPVSAIVGPRAFVTEYVLADYLPNGSFDLTEYLSPCTSNPCRYGIVEVSVPNNDDVLQQVRINLSSITNTNLQSITAYKNFLMSYPLAYSKQNVSVNTTIGEKDFYLITNENVAPTITLSITIKNLMGGEDIFDDDNIITSENTLNFTLNAANSGAIDLNNSRITIQFRKNVVGGADVINLSAPICESGSCLREDSDLDGYFDRIVWGVNLTKANSFNIQFNGTIISGTNFPDRDTSVNLDSDDKGVRANYTQNLTFTGIAITKKFAKSAFRQGVDMVQNSTSGHWLVRGYIVNMANTDVGENEHTLTYNVSSWRLYTINQTTGEPLENVQNGTFSQGILGAGETIFTTDPSSSNTSWHDSGSITKPFYGSYFDWQIIWNSTNSNNYYGFVDTTMDLQTLYKIDMRNEKSISGFGDRVTIKDIVTHEGDSEAPVKFIQILSVIPANTTTGEFHGRFDIDENSVKFYFDNTSLGGKSYELALGPYANLTLIDPSSNGSRNGLVNLTIIDLSSVSLVGGNSLGGYLKSKESIELVFDIISNQSMVEGDRYNFTGNSTMKTKSGTPLIENHPAKILEVTPLVIPPVPPPVVVPVAPPRIVNLSLEYKENISLNPGQASLIYILAKNTGNRDLHNLTLIISVYRKIIVEIYPEKIPLLPTDYSVIFLISLKIPKEILPGIYPMDFFVSSNEISKGGRILIEVEPVKIKLEVEQAIKNYAALIDRLQREIDFARERGRNITLPLKYLSLAKKELEAAKTYYLYENYEVAKFHLEKTKNYLEKVAIELAKYPIPSLPLIELAKYPIPSLPLIILVSVFLLIVIFHRRKKVRRRIKRKRRRFRRRKR
jgi:hypothetical protein